jgi:hypothetical protein
MRVPLWRAQPNSYLDWKRRKGGVHKLLKGTDMEIKQIELEVDRIAWERKLRAQPRFGGRDFDLNNKIIDVLEGIIHRSRETLKERELRDGALRSDSLVNVREYEAAIRYLEAHTSPVRSVKEVATLFPRNKHKLLKKLNEIDNKVYLCKTELIAGNF